MVNNSTKINKTNNYLLLPKNFQQQTATYGVENPGSGLGHASNVEGLNPLMIYQFSLFDNWISNRNTDANKRLKHAQILFHSQNNTHYHQNIGKLAESKNVRPWLTNTCI